MLRSRIFHELDIIPSGKMYKKRCLSSARNLTTLCCYGQMLMVGDDGIS